MTCIHAFTNNQLDNSITEVISLTLFVPARPVVWDIRLWENSEVKPTSSTLIKWMVLCCVAAVMLAIQNLRPWS